ncbi:MAG: sigma-70 family RNA polymerase sigma factor [Sedimentisphaerales bacterium]|nr:sigma-70 family RNA polymerase sigma factor [Sedimentisphaerales bacterium]
MDENKVIECVIQGDVNSFGLLVKRYQRPVIALVRDVVGDLHLAEDVAQEVFLAAFKKIHTYNPAKGCFSTWLFTIARNKSVNAIKRRRIRRVFPIQEERRKSAPDDQLQRRELFLRLDAALEELPIRLRTVFVLAVFHELPYEEIARIEGIRIGTVKSRISRVRKKLIVAMNGYLGEHK